MSMFYCSSCDMLVDSDAVLFVYDDVTDHWTCANCLEADPDIDAEKVLHHFNSRTSEGYVRWDAVERSTFHGDDVYYGGYNHKYDEPDTDRGGTDE